MMFDGRSDAQRAFIGLLARPLVTPWNHPQTHAAVRRHTPQLTIWAERLGYHLVHVNHSYRLRRVPIDGGVAAPVSDIPPRARLLYALYVAICLEQHRDESISLQEISDHLGQFASVGNRRPYDVRARPHRRLLVDAVELLTEHGVLERRTRQSMQDDWERSGEGIGAGFLLHRDALMLLVDTADVDLALARHGSTEDSRRRVILRTLLEEQALYPWELDDETRAYLTHQRSRIIHDAEQMTGGTVEVRADAWLLTLPADRQTPDEALIDFPDTTALDWACLAVIDALAPGGQGPVDLPRERLREITSLLHAERAQQLTASLRESPSALLAEVEKRLQSIGLIRITDDGWVLLPIAGRFRAAELRLAPRAEPSLFEGES